MRALSGGIAAIALGGALYVGARPIGSAPALGSFLDPAHGVWSVARTAELPREEARELTGLGGDVEVRYDDRGVPHIFAKTEADLYRALGWVHARDRLFQMEVGQRAVAGTLSELVGERALPLDREARRQSLAVAAEAKWAAASAKSEIRAAITAYMEGVNGYVASMRPAELPIEYRLLRATPMTFRPQDTYYLLARMALTLAYDDQELQRATVEALVGPEAAAALFPVNAPLQEPIEPVPGRTAPREAWVPLPPPLAPSPTKVATATRQLRDLTAWLGTPAPTRGEAVVGSNNWAVAPSRSATGHALLAGDPHLQLTLPSIWYEVHLVVPGTLDSYGVSLPLAPILPIGFNRDVAWTATNTGADVMDFYREKVDVDSAPTRYEVDGNWRSLSRRIEQFKDRAGAVLRTDTLYATHRGPLLRVGDDWLSMRWTALEPSDEGDAFRSAMRATSADEWYAAMADYQAPAQNFLVADRGGHIGIRSTGRYPLRPGDGLGTKIFDGTTSASDWTGAWPLAQYPQTRDPAQGYIASANQQPLDPAVRPGYLGSNWATPWRALRINQILRADSAMTPASMQAAHTDPFSALTDPVRNAVLAAVERARTANTLTADQRAAAELLARWDGRFDRENKEAVLFTELYNALVRRTWDELEPGDGSDGGRRVATPNSLMLVALLRDSTSAWWDVRSTPAVETQDTILLGALTDGWVKARATQGNDPSTWRWSNARSMNIHHLLRLPGFGRERVAIQSGPGTLSPSESNGTHGASWRFVVELGPELKAWGTYPGGQSGNPVSSRYDDRLAIWQDGKLAPLHFPRRPADLVAEKTLSTLTLRAAR